MSRGKRSSRGEGVGDGLVVGDNPSLDLTLEKSDLLLVLVVGQKRLAGNGLESRFCKSAEKVVEEKVRDAYWRCTSATSSSSASLVRAGVEAVLAVAALLTEAALAAAAGATAPATPAVP